MPKIEEKPAFWYDGKAYKTRLEAQKAEFQALFEHCKNLKNKLFGANGFVIERLGNTGYWSRQEGIIEELTEALQDLLCYRKRLLPLIEQEQEKKEIAPDWGKSIEDYFSQHNPRICPVPNGPDEVA